MELKSKGYESMVTWQIQKITISEDYYFSLLNHKGSKNVTVLFIHGLGSTKKDFIEAIKYPKLQEYTLLAVDLLGHGDSAKPVDFSYSMKDQARYLAKLLKKLDSTKTFVLVAHSMGGPIAIILAELLQSDVKAIVYAEGNIDFNDCFGSNEIITSGSLQEWEKTNFQKSLESIKSKSELAEYAESFQKAGPRTLYKSSIDLVQLSQKGNLLQRLIELGIPVLSIYGEENRGKFTSEKKIQQYFPIKYLSESGHAMMISNPDEFYFAIEEFIDELNSY